MRTEASHGAGPVRQRLESRIWAQYERSEAGIHQSQSNAGPGQGVPGDRVCRRHPLTLILSPKKGEERRKKVGDANANVSLTSPPPSSYVKASEDQEWGEGLPSEAH